MTPQNPKPSMHDIMTGFFVPNAKDLAAGIKGGFGSTTNVINGYSECGGGNRNAQLRGEYFLEFLTELGLENSDETHLTCDEGRFPEEGAGDMPIFFQNGLD